MTGQCAIVVGAGVVGLCCAYELVKRGFKVTVIDSGPPGSGCSFGNAGALSPGSVVPVALPGAAMSGLKMLLERDGALTIKPSYALKLAPWLWRFVKASTPERVEAIATALAALNGGGLEKHKSLMREVGAPELVKENGQLYVYRGEEQLKKDAFAWELRRRHGGRVEKLDAGALHDLEPAIGPGYTIGMLLPDAGHCADPLKHAEAIAGAIARAGGTFVRARVSETIVEDGRVAGVRSAEGEHRAGHVVLAAGAWSAELLRSLGYRVPLESQRGYHVEFASAGIDISRPVTPADRKVFVTPMEGRLRVAGSVEFAGLSSEPTQRRGDLLLGDIRAVFPQADLTRPSPYWMGHRPCLPDSLPVIGPAPRHPGLWLAFGHGHLGLTGSAPTGQLVAEQMAGGRPNIDLAPYSVDRF